jgi:hypothetical protein
MACIGMSSALPYALEIDCSDQHITRPASNSRNKELVRSHRRIAAQRETAKEAVSGRDTWQSSSFFVSLFLSFQWRRIEMERKAVKFHLMWGPFRYFEEERLLVLVRRPKDPSDREIELELLNTPVNLLHTFGHYRMKVWFTPRMAWHFWQAMDDLFDIRSFAELEPGQRATPRTVKQILKKYAKRDEKPFTLSNVSKAR